MTSSLRGRLLLWYTTMVAVVMLVFGGIVCYLAWRAGLNDVDAALRSRAQTLADGLRPVGPDAFDLILPPDPAAPIDRSYYVVWAPSGALIDTSDVQRGRPQDHHEGFHTRNGSRELTLDASDAHVLVGHSLDALWRETLSLAATMTSVGLAALAVSFIGGWFLVTRALLPINRINDTARAMADGDFTARIPVNRVETELWQLSRALNEAFERLHAALERQRRFTADASHELRTPLTVISTEANWAMRRDRPVEDYRHSLEVCQRASHRMQGVVERLLALARADIRNGDIERLPVRLHEVVESALRHVRPLADARGLNITLDAAPVDCLGDCDRLLDAITNVVTNAIQYNVPNGGIGVQVCEEGDHAEVVVCDTGIGIADEHLPHIFEPFFRGDPARTRAVAGSGLGLTVARAIVRQHGGGITCDSEIGRGTTVRVRLPNTAHKPQRVGPSQSTPSDRPCTLRASSN